jgi:uncharacterized protein (DUF58 family)
MFAPLDMAELAALTSLPLRARCLADAVGAGRHRSRRRGATVEFADYRDYHPGDDLRRVDWRLLARTDRAHLREAHEETPMRVLLLLDVSASMNYASRPKLMTKLDYGRSALAALSLVVRRQRDAGGIGLLAEELSGYLPPSSSPGRLRSLWATLETPASSRQTPLARTLAQAADAAPRACLFVIASDFYEEADAIADVIRRLRFEGHDALALHLADPEEEDFTFSDPAQFQDPETGSELPLDPPAAAAAYRAAFAAHRVRIHDLFLENGFAHLSLRTDVAPVDALSAYLAVRAGRS